MPFKRNPIKAENIDSLGRWVMAQTQVLWNNAAHSLLERTLDDSANRRSVLPEMFLAVEEMLLQTKGILTGLVINTDQIERNMAYYGPFAATEPLMMALVKAGADRQEMHERLREHSLHAWEMLTKEENNPLIEELAGDEHLTHFLTPDAIRATMDAKSHVGDAPQRARQLAQQIRAAF
jgi:adenylosuccinate lyase